MNDDERVVYQDSKGEWRWRVIANNGEIIGASTEGYINFEDAVSNLLRICGPEVLYFVHEGGSNLA